MSENDIYDPENGKKLSAGTGNNHALGTIRTHIEGTNERILIPQPSNDPNDPLNWSPRTKLYLAVLASFSLLISNFFASGPSVSLIEVSIFLFKTPIPNPANPATLAPDSIARFTQGIEKSAYLFSGTALAQGMSNLVYIPLAVKYGRRPIYIITLVGFVACCLWCALSKSYGVLLAGRIVGGWFAGMAECIVPLTIADVFFLHERARYMAMYSMALSCGGAFGSIIGGAMSVSLAWQNLYYLLLAIVATVALMIYFTMPETFYVRTYSRDDGQVSHGGTEKTDDQHVDKYGTSIESNNIPRKRTFKENLTMFNGTLTHESFLKIFIRPIIMLALPPVLWATACLGLGVGIYVIISSTLAQALANIHHFDTWQIGMVWWAAIVGSVVGMPVGGNFSDWVADTLSKRNNGIREPEFRLPALVPAMFAFPGSLLLYGLGFHYETHWIVPTLGVGMLAFALSASGSITMSYTIDAYRPIAGEVVVTQMGFKSVVAFLMAFYANPWIEKDGYDGSFIAMAVLVFFVYFLWIPLFIWGKSLRHATIKWRLMKMVEWDEDRETGE